MDVGHVKGPGGVDPTRNQPERSRTAADSSREAGDQAQVSKAAQRALELEQGIQSDSRAEKVDAARQRLVSGELDQSEVYRTVADRILGSGDEPEV